IVAEIGHKKVCKAVIIEIASADTLAPASLCEPRVSGYITKLCAAFVVIKNTGGLRPIQPGAVYQENVGLSIIVEIKDGGAVSSHLQNVLLTVYAAVSVCSRETCLGGDVAKPDFWAGQVEARLGRTARDCLGAASHSLRQQKRHRRGDERHHDFRVVTQFPVAFRSVQTYNQP